MLKRFSLNNAVYIIYFFLSLLLFSISFPSKHLWFSLLGWIGLAPLFFINEKLGFKKSYFTSFIFFVLLFLVLLWINPFSEPEKFKDQNVIILIVLFFVVLPFICASILAFSKFIASKNNPYMRPIIYSIFWVSFEYLSTLVPNGFPISIAITQANNPYLLQLVPFMGIYWISFLLIATNSLIASYFIEKKKVFIIIAFMVFSLNFIFGYFNLNSYSISNNNNPTTIGIVQPNITWRESSFSKNPFFLRLFLDRLYMLSIKLKNLKTPSIILWPELSTNCYFLQSYDRLLGEYVEKLKIPLLVGTYFYDHKINRPNNIAALISDSGAIIGIYKKNKLFPFYESSDYKEGGEVMPLSFDRNGLNEIGVMLCFESLYPQISKKLAMQGANVLILLGNGAYFGDSRWAYLHMAYIIYRALENGKYAINLNNTGPSAIVSDKGIIDCIIPQSKAAIAATKIEPKENLTFYTRSNELFPKLILILIFIFILRHLSAHIQLKKQH